MKKLPIFAIISFASINTLLQTWCIAATCPIAGINPRAPGQDKVMQVVGMAEDTHLFDMESWYGIFSVTPEYKRTFQSSNIARLLFGQLITDSEAPTGTSLLVQGSAVANRNSNALVADNFYLPPDFDSIVFVRPQITWALLNFDFYIGFDEWCDGLYFRFYGPYVYTKWDLNIHETVNNDGTAGYAAGIFTQLPLDRDALLEKFTLYARGQAPVPTIGTGTPINPSTPTAFDPLSAARLTDKTETDYRFADLRAEIGWDLCNDDDSHIGINGQLTFPTGDVQQKSHLLFSPIIGNGAWEIGAGLTAHYTLWRSQCCDSFFGVFLDANINHVFSHHERRSFDLKDKPLSRYLLAEKFGPNEQNLSNASNQVAPVQFAYACAPVANLTFAKIKVKYDVEADIVCWFNFCYQGLSFDIGYDFWARSHEVIELAHDDHHLSQLDGKTWGIKGSSQIIGFAATNSGPDPIVLAGNAVGLSATQSQATINIIIPNEETVGLLTTVNTGIDNSTPAFAGGTPTTPLTAIRLASPTTSIINTSIDPILLQKSDINFAGGARSLSNKIFTHLQYTFDQEGWVPYIGMGGFAEFGAQRHRTALLNASGTPVVSERRIRNNALSMWAVWIKLGIAFN